MASPEDELKSKKKEIKKKSERVKERRIKREGKTIGPSPTSLG